MNLLIFIAGLFALFTTLGHFTMGSRAYLEPMMQANFDEVAKKVMQSVFHYVSIFLIFSSGALLAIGYGVNLPFDTDLTVKFISINYAGFSLAEIIIALNSRIEKGILKMFQWIFFIIIAAFAWSGVP